ncbi:winged helix-turn-helix domain-containing protein [Pleionea mediterranea]|uniref:DNA-binding winged helix-turn-helix (WHTH) protein n=1 Tax=Pleionea mediterranea TaxID=523701 RepID=A0A316FPM9_9GAMM|nr:transcriptional regulator [Pleionea mediterranea]PWK50092.1 DNA-binding winged helix-turn-helix (wHTH) protein [Pleionea mediterranea]
MSSGCYCFEGFKFNPVNRQLYRDGHSVELNARYLDALALLVQQPGRLISKQQFFDSVWQGTAVTDEALTQCIRVLRKQLGDSASKPSFIETVPKHGYRFIAPVIWHESGVAKTLAEQNNKAFTANDSDISRGIDSPDTKSHTILSGDSYQTVARGVCGSAIAGIIGGLIFGLITSLSASVLVGAVSSFLVLVSVTMILAIVGGAGISIGLAAAERITQKITVWSIVGAAIGGMTVGAVVKLLGVDAFHLLLGQSLGDITGPMEGAVLGASVGIMRWLSGQFMAFNAQNGDFQKEDSQKENFQNDDSQNENYQQNDSQKNNIQNDDFQIKSDQIKSSQTDNPQKINLQNNNLLNNDHPTINAQRITAMAVISGAIAGALIYVLDGQLLAGSLNILAEQFPNSRFTLNNIAPLFGEEVFGPVSLFMCSVIEGAVYCASIVAALNWRRSTLP